MSRKIIFIVGPTAVGKTDVAVRLAQKLKGEIVSCDSMQVYKEVSIASSRPSPAHLKKIKHHLIGIVSVKQEFDAATFRQKADRIIRAILKRGKIPVVCGGSGMYMQVLLDGIFEKGGRNSRVRARLEKELKVGGADRMHARLKKIDPPAAAKIHANDHRRLIRALEVFELKKKPMSEVKTDRQGLWDQYDVQIFVLTRPRDELYRRINDRVGEMFESGLVKEIKKIRKFKLSKTSRGMIGLKEVSGFLDGEYELARAQYLLQRNTRHFAKRQMTWFRKDKRLQWIDIHADDTLDSIVNTIRRFL